MEEGGEHHCVHLWSGDESSVGVYTMTVSSCQEFLLTGQGATQLCPADIMSNGKK